MELEQLLSANASVESAVEAAIREGLVEHFRAALPDLYADAARGAEIQGVVEVLTPWFATYPQPERTENEWREWWSAYVGICGHHSRAALSGAMKAWAAKSDSEFMPKPGALSELARVTPTAAFRLAARVHEILQLADDRMDRARIGANMERDQVKPAEQVAAVQTLLAEFNAKSAPVRQEQQRILQRGVKGAERPESEQPYIGGTPAPGSALTPEMLRKLGRPIPGGEPRDEPIFSEDR